MVFKCDKSHQSKENEREYKWEKEGKQVRIAI